MIVPGLQWLGLDPIGRISRWIHRLEISRRIRHWYRRRFVPTLNIRSDSRDWRAAILSNLAKTPFVIDGVACQSLESFLQAIKFSRKQERQEILMLSGMDALKRGRTVTQSVVLGETKVYWRGEEMLYGSDGHRLLLVRAIQAKIDQNERVRQALLETKGVFLFHDVGQEHPHTSLPEQIFVAVLVNQRDLLLKVARLRLID